MSSTTCIGESIFPLMFAGHESVHLPQTAQAYPSKKLLPAELLHASDPEVLRRFQVDCLHRPPTAFNEWKNALKGVATMCMCLEKGMYTANPRINSRCAHPEQPVQQIRPVHAKPGVRKQPSQRSPDNHRRLRPRPPPFRHVERLRQKAC